MHDHLCSASERRGDRVRDGEEDACYWRERLAAPLATRPDRVQCERANGQRNTRDEVDPISPPRPVGAQLGDGGAPATWWAEDDREGRADDGVRRGLDSKLIDRLSRVSRTRAAQLVVTTSPANAVPVSHRIAYARRKRSDPCRPQHS